MKKLSRLLSSVAMAFVMLITASSVICAEESEQPPESVASGEGTITVTLTDPETSADAASVHPASKEGVLFDLVKVAEIKDGSYILNETFEKSFESSSLQGTANEVSETAAKMEVFVAENKVASFAQEKTDASGTAVFSNVPSGVYLLYASSRENYELVSPALVAIPEYNEETGEMNFSVTVEPKHTALPKLPIVKTDSETGKAITSDKAEFGIYSDEACTNQITTLTTDQNGETALILDYGTYYLKETKAPAGYIQSDQVITIHFDASGVKIMMGSSQQETVAEVKEDGLLETLEIPNELQKTPQTPSKKPSTSTTGPSTGEQTGKMIWILAGVAALALIVILIVVQIKKHKQKK